MFYKITPAIYYLIPGFEATWMVTAPPKLLPNTNNFNFLSFLYSIAYLRTAYPSLRKPNYVGIPSLSEYPRYAINITSEFVL